MQDVLTKKAANGDGSGQKQNHAAPEVKGPTTPPQDHVDKRASCKPQAVGASTNVKSKKVVIVPVRSTAVDEPDKPGSSAASNDWKAGVPFHDAVLT